MSLPVILRPPAEADIRETRATFEAIQAGLFAAARQRIRRVRWLAHTFQQGSYRKDANKKTDS